jgi:threonine synthase
MVSDTAILNAYHLMATKEGIFGEPASAASFAGLLKLSKQDYDFSGKRIVCIVTGNGLKDADTALKDAGQFAKISPVLEDVERVLGWR